MKHHSKTYENLFSTDKDRAKAKFYIEGACASEMDFSEYVLTFRNFLTDFYSNLFDYCVKLSWLRRKFIYKGNRLTLPMNENGISAHLAFVKMLRRHVGKDIQIITKWKFFSKIELYFDELFPEFDEESPFENPDYYQYPFNHVTVDFLMVVHQLDNRMELLKYAEDKELSYAVFVDYVVNYVLSENDELGRIRYEMRQKKDRNFPFYVKDKDKELKKYIPKRK